MYCLHYGIKLNKEIIKRHDCIKRCCPLLKLHVGGKIIKMRKRKKNKKHKINTYEDKKRKLRNLKKVIKNKGKIDFNLWNSLI